MTTDPLANVERLLEKAVLFASGESNVSDFLSESDEAAAREAVRLLIDVARNVTDEEAAPSALGASVSALLTFARSLDE